MNKKLLFFFTAVFLVALSAFRPHVAHVHNLASDKEKIWVEDSLNKIRYMKKVVLLTGRHWQPEKNELNFQISSANIGGKKNSELTVKVKYGGGCKIHRFQLVKPHQTSKDTFQLYLIHEPFGDNCRAFVNNEMTFNIGRLKLKKIKRVVMLNNFRVK
jgi:hypothetical protein